MRRRVWLSVIAIGLLGCGLSATLSFRLRDAERATLDLEFRRIVDEQVASLEREMALNIEVLFAIHSLFAASDAVDNEVFATITRGILPRHQGIQALEWIPRILDSERGAAETARRDLFPSFQITERIEQGKMVRARQREEYFPVYFVEPYLGNEAALGFDLASDPIRRAALRESRDKGTIQLTASIELVQENESQRGFLAFVPVYRGESSTVEERRRSLRGFALGVYRIGDIFAASIFEGSTTEIEMDLIDVTEEGSPDTLHHHPLRSGEDAVGGTLYRRPLKDLGGRRWAVVASPASTFVRDRASGTPQLALVGGVFLTLAIIVYVVILERRSHIVNELVRQRTRELRKSEETSRAILSTAAEAVITIDASGTILSFNPAAERIFGYESAEALGRNVSLIMPEPYKSEHDDYIGQYLETGMRKILGIGREVVGQRKDGTKFPIYLAVSEVRTDDSRMFTGIVRDISERIQAEEALAQAHQHETEIAAHIQETLLLGKPPEDIPGIQLAALTVASQTVDGDFYDFRQFGGNKQCLDIIIGDVMGKGIPAALLGAATKGHLERTISALWHDAPDNALPTPEEIVNVLHEVLVKELIDLESFVTLCYARFTMDEQRLDFVDCGHPNTIHYRRSRNECIVLSGENMPLGVSEDEVYTQNSITFERGDLFLFYSDGITEARNEAGEFFGEARLLESVFANNRLQPAGLLESLRHSVVESSGSDVFADDLTCVAVKITDTAGEESLLHAEHEASSDLKELARVRAFFRSFCRDLPAPGIGEDDLNHLEIAVNEALANIIQHAYGGRSGQKIQILADAYAGRICVRLYHWGEPLEEDTAPPPAPDGSRESGFGLYLIAQSVDEVRYSRDEQGRNCVFLVKRLPKGRDSFDEKLK